MKQLLKLALLLGAASTLSLAVNASEHTHGAASAPAKADQSSTQSRVFDVNSTASGSDERTASVATPTENSGEHGQAPSTGDAGHWGYAGVGGPDQWGGMSADYHLCSAGKMQSPVDIDNGVGVKASPISFNYSATGLTIGNNGHTIQVDYASGSHIVVEGRRFDLLQLHFHTPSEHLITGKQYPIEMHLVHKNAGGELAVVGVMFESGANNIVLGEIWNHLPHQAGDPGEISGVVINARDLLPENQTYHHYKGSLTTPPCSEGVNWLVMDSPSAAGAMQITQFMDIIGENARPVQSMENRLLISSKGH